MNRDDTLKKGLEELKISWTDKQLELLGSFIDELLFWNRRLNLVKSDEESLMYRHIIDALAPLKIIEKELPKGAIIADVGSGAGLPGIPLAIFLSDVRLYLIERSGKRAGFLRSAIVAAGLAGRAEVLHADVRSCGIEADAVVIRAFRPLPEALPLLLPVLAPGGRIFAYHGRRTTIEAELTDPLVKEFLWKVVPLSSGGDERERHLVYGGFPL